MQDLLNPLQAKLMIPAFLKGRKNLSAAEELSTRKIAKARIHIERFNQSLQQFHLHLLPLPHRWLLLHVDW